MKKLVFIIVLVTVTVTYSQYTMVVGTNDAGIQTIIPAGNIDQMTFYPACSGTPSVTYEGKVYATVYIGSQCWLAENLNVGTRIDGSSVQDDNSIIEKYCYNDLDINCDIYGGLYQWDETMQYVTTAGAQGICPTGWHIPTNTQFSTLKSAVGNDVNKLLAVGQGGGTNTSGFSALLGGFRVLEGTYNNLSSIAYFWSSTVYIIGYSYYMSLDTNPGFIEITITNTNINQGFSVRCLKN